MIYFYVACVYIIGFVCSFFVRSYYSKELLEGVAWWPRSSEIKQYVSEINMYPYMTYAICLKSIFWFITIPTTILIFFIPMSFKFVNKATVYFSKDSFEERSKQKKELQKLEMKRNKVKLSEASYRELPRKINYRI